MREVLLRMTAAHLNSPILRRTGLAVILTLGLILASEAPANAICNPGRPPTSLTYFSGGNQYAYTVSLAGATIGYYTPYVDQAANSRSASWVMLFDYGCSEGFAQAGFAQQPGDSHDSVFAEDAFCNSANPIFEFPDLPRVASHFNVRFSRPFSSLEELQTYDGSTTLTDDLLDWQPYVIQVIDETQNYDDQGYGGYNNKILFTDLAYHDSSGYHSDALGLTPNNVSSSNELNPPDRTNPNILLYLPGGDKFETYDTGCAT